MLPAGTLPFFVAAQPGELGLEVCVWARVLDAAAPPEPLPLYLTLSGSELPVGAIHVGSALIGVLAYHVFGHR